jgi:DNA-binding protein H-NS
LIVTQTYSQIRKQIEILERKAEKLRTQELDEVISRIKVAIAHYGISAEQLGYGASAKATRAVRVKSSSGPSSRTSYADDHGNSWSGHGRRPGWLLEALAAGKTLEQMATPSATSTVKASTAKSSPKKKRVTKASYRDDAGHSWSGFGPRPRWLKDAIASGRTLEELAA